jgi:hypothetical protein
MEPPTPYNRDTVQWLHEPGRPQVGEADWRSVPLHWVQAFVKGETALCGCDFYVRNSVKAGQKGCPASVLSRKVFHCHHGPEDRTVPAAREAASASAKERASLVAKGESIKVGCKCHFSVTVLKATPTCAEIRYIEREHTGHADRRMAAYLSEEASAWVWMQLAQGITTSTKDIARRNRERFLAPLRAARPDIPPEKLQEFFVANNPPRDWYLTAKDINNIREEVKRATFKRNGNEAQSLRLIYERFKENMFIYQARSYARGPRQTHVLPRALVSVCVYVQVS